MNSRTSSFPLFVTFICLFMSLSASASDVKWAPLFFMDDQIFPSYILATATWSGNSDQMSTKAGGLEMRTLGERNSVFAVIIENPAPQTKVSIGVRFDQISETSTFEGTLAEPDVTYIIFPKIKYRYDVLPRIQQPIVVNATIGVALDGKVIGQTTKTVQVRSINDAPIAFAQGNGKYDDMGWMFSAYVNENHPWIDPLLREALNYGTIPRFIGYQGAPQDVYAQVFSIWNVLQRRGVRYSSITTPSGNNSGKVFSQHVRFFEDTIRNAQANCVDGSVLFASILRKIGIDPFLVLVPGHMYLGFYLDASHTHAAYLETTMMGEIDLRRYPEDRTLTAAFASLLGGASRNTASWNSFRNAINQGALNVQRDGPSFSAANFPRYQILEIADHRRLGVLPINR